MNSKLLFIIFFLLAMTTFNCKKDDNTTQSQTTGSIKGKVADSTSGAVIENVFITTQPASDVAITNPLGDYRLMGLSPATYVVQASKTGYKSKTQNVTVSAGNIATADFLLVATSEIPTNGLVAYYPFNGNANDESGNGNNGTVNGATLTSDRFGNSNSAYSFDGSSYINVSSITFTSGFTLSGWINLAGFVPLNGAALISKFQSGGNGYELLVTGTSEGNKLRLITGSSSYITDTTVTFQANQWYFVSGTFDGVSSGKLYINGNLFFSSALSPLGSSPLNTFIGKSAWGGNSTVGLIDDIRIYNRALTDIEIQSLYREGGW